MVTFDDAVGIFDDQYAQSSGFGTASLPLDGWSDDNVKRFLVHCDQAATNRGASLKGALVGVNVARKLGITTIIGQGENFDGIPCFVTAMEDDRLVLIFGPSQN